jgi:hypothetical protein
MGPVRRKICKLKNKTRMKTKVKNSCAINLQNLLLVARINSFGIIIVFTSTRKKEIYFSPYRLEM